MVILKQMNDKETAMKKGMDTCNSFQSSCSGGIALCEIDEKHFQS